MGQTASENLSTPARRRRRVRAAAVAMPIAASMLLAGCSAGQLAQTSQVQSEVAGVMADIGTLHIRNASIVPPTTHYFPVGSTLYLQMDIANGGSEDQLTTATIDGVDARIQPAAPSSTSSGAQATPGSAAPRTAAGPSASTTAGPGSITIPSGGIASINDNDNMVSADAKAKLYPAENIEVVLTFKNAGQLKMQIPIGEPLTETPKVNSDKIDLHPNTTKGEVD